MSDDLDVTEEERRKMDELVAMREELQAGFNLVETKIENLRLRRKIRLLEARLDGLPDSIEVEKPEGTE